jgi:F-type H+-transporting ATPase subunit delta
MSGMAVAAKRYAKALFAVVKEQGVVDETRAQLEAISQALAGDAGIRAFFEHPNVEAETKIDLLKKAVGNQLSDVVLRTLQLLIERGRASSVPAVYAAFVEIADEALGRAHALVSSAYELTAAQQQEIAAKFGELTGKKITVDTVVDASLLGGVRIRIGDTLYDGSLATKLAELEKSFNKAR